MPHTSIITDFTLNQKEDFKKTFIELINPIIPLYSKGRKGRLDFGGSGSVYSEDIRQIESFLRPLWGFGPFLVKFDHDYLKDSYLDGIRAGINPEHPDYWGVTDDYDQRLVEMASLANMLLLVKEKTWDCLTNDEQDQLYNWLMQINQHEIPKSNWLFFRILVNISMKKCGREWDKDRVEKDFEIIESCYIGNGWYFDENPTQIDYYISFAIHYYGLIYYKYMKDEDPLRSDKIKSRAITFAQTFKYWFDEKGEAVPYGRSLTYRFSQCAFWTALVFADVEALSWSEIKGIINRNMKQWLQQDIFSRDGVLTIGYHYQNLVMAEGYNAPGSPYWALKSFLLLAVANDHPFWEASIAPLNIEQKQIAIPEARMLISHSDDQLQAYVAGQIERKQAHVDAKYSKLVYSTRFGVSVSKGSIYYKQGGFDNCLALSEGNTYYRSKLESESYEISEIDIVSTWWPWPNVKIITRIIPIDEWHIRIHEIQNERKLHAIEGGFSVPIEKTDHIIRAADKTQYISRVGTSTAIALKGYTNADVQIPEPNTNLYFKRSAYPILEADLEIGEHVLISLIGGTASKDQHEEVPQISVTDTCVNVTYRGQIKSFSRRNS